MPEPPSLSEHKKSGDTLYTPINFVLKDRLELTEWSHDFLPQYVWIGLIIKRYGRKIGLKLLYEIIVELNEHKLCIAELSAILNLSAEQQREFYNILDSYIEVETLSPLTTILSAHTFPEFFNHYFYPQLSVEGKLKLLDDFLRDTLSFHDELSTDICFVVVWFYVKSGHLHIGPKVDILAEALKNYYTINHEDEEMRLYRPVIRSAAQGLLSLVETREFSHLFWNNLSEITPCNPLIIQYEGTTMRNDYIEDLNKLLEYISVTSKDRILDKKFTVTAGILVYAIRLYTEIVNTNLENSISSRIIFRSILESYINLKYLLLKEDDEPKIFDYFMDYGLGKYKLIMSKLREGKYNIPSESHINPDLMEIYVNENKHESFYNISLGYFEKDTIKSKCTQVGEERLYEIYYEYTTNFSHGFWGAIRESSMLICDNPSHSYHAIPDYSFEQNLKDISYDCMVVLKKLVCLSSQVIELPDFYTKKYQVNNV